MTNSSLSCSRSFSWRLPLTVATIALLPLALLAQDREQPGRSIGKVSVLGKLIVVELNPGALGNENLFNLDHSTLRFTPGQEGYGVERLPLAWDAEYGQKIGSPDVTLHNFKFPFSGAEWSSFSVGLTGSIRFTTPGAESHSGGAGGFRGGVYQSYRGEEGGVSLGRFTPLGEGASDLVNGAPAICVFFKPRMTGDRYVKELADRVVVTWDLTEPYGNIQDFTWVPTVNRFQLVLFHSGVIQMSYQQVAAKDAIVGVYPAVSGSEKPLATVAGSPNSSAPAYLDIQDVKLSVVANLFLKVTLETRGPALHEGDAQLSGIGYQISFSGGNPGAAPCDSRLGYSWLRLPARSQSRRAALFCLRPWTFARAAGRDRRQHDLRRRPAAAGPARPETHPGLGARLCAGFGSPGFHRRAAHGCADGP